MKLLRVIALALILVFILETTTPAFAEIEQYCQNIDSARVVASNGEILTYTLEWLSDQCVITGYSESGEVVEMSTWSGKVVT